jgi:hypothetical protein
MDPLPRYFTARAEENLQPVAAGAACGVIDHFSLHQAGVNAECAVTTDALGNLALLAGPDLEAASEDLRGELAYHEVSGQQVRRLQAEEVYLFNAQLLEQPAGAPGLDDSLYLYGTLFGPYPNLGPALPAGVEGRLTVTRSDLLFGLAQGFPDAFRYAEPDSPGKALRRCFHALLPGDRQEALQAGRGLVFAYPLLPSELFQHADGNDLVVRQLFYDVLTALREDAAAEGVPLLAGVPLPVPSRAVVEQELLADGYAVAGEVARRAPGPAVGFAGLLRSVFGQLMTEEVQLPPEGSVEDYVQLVHQSLAALPGFRSGRAQVLQQRVTHGSIAPSPVRPVPVRPSPTPTSPPPPRTTLSTRADPADWMQDFAGSRRAASAPPRITSSRAVGERHRPNAQAGKPQDRPSEWMKDFAAPQPEPDSPVEKREPGSKPEWMRDFE